MGRGCPPRRGVCRAPLHRGRGVRCAGAWGMPFGTLATAVPWKRRMLADARNNKCRRAECPDCWMGEVPCQGCVGGLVLGLEVDAGEAREAAATGGLVMVWTGFAVEVAARSPDD